jgi:molybdenum cofactor synthesis domain-containing protein
MGGEEVRPFTQLISLDEALRITLEAARPVERVETVHLWEAVGRVLAEDVVAPMDVPGFDKAAMDGFALRSEDVTNREDARLRIVGRAHPGEPFDGVVGPGECVEVATGAPVPEGCDTVIEVELVDVLDGEVLLRKQVKPGRNVSPKGEDIRTGDALVQAGTVLKPGHLGAISALGFQEVRVYERPRVAVFATGREVRRSGPLGPGDVYDINSYTLAGLIRESGCDVHPFDPIPDEYEDIEGAVSRAREYHAVVLSGSTSVGERDFLRDAASALGEVLYHGVASKPGKPLLLARVDGGLVFGMPGFPASCLMLAYHVLLPALRRMARLPFNPRTLRGTLGEDMPVKEDKVQLVTVHMEGTVVHRAFRKSGSITSVSRGEGYIVVPAGRRLVKGEEVEVILF